MGKKIVNNKRDVADVLFSDHTFYEVANQMMQECFDEADREADLIFGNNENPPDDESELIFSEPFGNLSLPAKLQALTELRAKKGEKAN